MYFLMLNMYVTKTFQFFLPFVYFKFMFKVFKQLERAGLISSPLKVLLMIIYNQTKRPWRMNVSPGRFNSGCPNKLRVKSSLHMVTSSLVEFLEFLRFII